MSRNVRTNVSGELMRKITSRGERGEGRGRCSEEDAKQSNRHTEVTERGQEAAHPPIF